MPSGGYRKPANPAPVSGPGAHSRRTDGAQPVMEGLGNGQYGAEQELQQLQGAAPMAQAPTGPPGPSGTPVDPTGGLTALSAPSQMPDVPVTDGAKYGAGSGMDAIGVRGNPDQQDAVAIAKYLPFLMKQANNENATPGYKEWLRQLIVNLNSRS